MKPKPLAKVNTEALEALRTKTAQREEEEQEKFNVTDKVDAKILEWTKGRQDNLRALLCALTSVLWAELEWKPISLSELIQVKDVKIKYMRAIAKVHPDKVKHGL